MPKATIKNNSVPIGAYTCTFDGIEEVDHPEYGPGWKWIFSVIGGEHEGRPCYRTTKDEPTPKNSCGRFLAALSGSTPADDLEVDTDDFLGHSYMCMVEASPSGEGTRIGSFVPTEARTPEL
ncbi:MAG: hypothetical protein HQ567_04940 [Candidatus Nealsonbacteria bacterium]|nr:hypothetical protein [Candidatus Nealsonbacteria bacterium]